MSKKNNKRSAKKQKFKTIRRNKRILRKMERADNSSKAAAGGSRSNVVAGDGDSKQSGQLMSIISRKRLAAKAKRKERRTNQRALKRMIHDAKCSKAPSTVGDSNIVVAVDSQQSEENNACNHYDIPEDTIRSWYERIRSKLNEDATKRVYHNWSCMLAPKRIELETAKPHIVLAAFFQYYEFDLERSCVQDNCKIFKEFCQDGLIEDENMKLLVCRLLGEKSTEAINADIDYDMAFLQDLDLLILASTPDVYKNYAQLSQQEWSTAGKTNFDMLRRKTLTTLLALDIYQTPEFSNKYAKIARANIEQELKELENC